MVNKGALNKFTRQNKNERAGYKRRKTKIAPKERDISEKDDFETLGTINMIVGGYKL